ncbi:hypothetical protein SLEP1_g10428 [Rubroshorea leprosula]|uniref:Phorbol-ester/DAG-type domain-containing protein n=1 Tax=Rubroshorea leprosula TaxID=152421 RepID=A0AAV5IHY2_9ROSI|nr:hypothetical protein SLEP1_g10428 [Rubroshorea leprosula]
MPGFFEPTRFHGTQALGSLEPMPGFFEPARFHGTQPWVLLNPGVGSMEPRRGFEKPSKPRFLEHGKARFGTQRRTSWVPWNPTLGSVEPRRGFNGTQGFTLSPSLFRVGSEEVMGSIDHFSHPHPLVLVDQEPGDHGSRKGFCSGCNEAVEGYCYECGKAAEGYCSGCDEELERSSYGCGECGFFLHKKCAELQTLCDFDLDLRCAMHPQFVAQEFQKLQHFSHDHPLILVEDIEIQTTREVCSGCREPMSKSSPFYCCPNCIFHLHKKCAELPLKVSHPAHRKHPLMLLAKPPPHQEKCSCNLCDCNYFAHVNCAIDKRLLEDEKSEPSDDWTAIFPAFQEIKPGEIKHFSHKHNLILSDDGVEDGQSCEGCMRSISTSFYYCAQCNFFLCNCCVHKLPKEVRHWTCKHLRELYFYSIFCCDYCWFWSSGFGYNCNACRKIMCIQCHEILDTRIVNIEGQEHFLFFDHKYKGKCNGCDDYCYRCSFRCKDKKCNFTLDYRCLVLPETARYKYDYHALSLTYRDDHDLSQCYCDICEETRDPKQWFYHCADCDVSAHPNCVLWKSPFVKLGKPFRIDDHEHPVTLVKIDFYPPKCNYCGKPCRDDLSIQCTEPDCTYIFHWRCYRERKGSWVWPLRHRD